MLYKVIEICVCLAEALAKYIRKAGRNTEELLVVIM
jgi:NTP pyrophosphatase (non-canonical NTP hydrolase)